MLKGKCLFGIRIKSNSKLRICTGLTNWMELVHKDKTEEEKIEQLITCLKSFFEETNYEM